MRSSSWALVLHVLLPRYDLSLHYEKDIIVIACVTPSGLYCPAKHHGIRRLPNEFQANDCMSFPQVVFRFRKDSELSLDRPYISSQLKN